MQQLFQEVASMIVMCKNFLHAINAMWPSFDVLGMKFSAILTILTVHWMIMRGCLGLTSSHSLNSWK